MIRCLDFARKNAPVCLLLGETVGEPPLGPPATLVSFEGAVGLVGQVLHLPVRLGALEA